MLLINLKTALRNLIRSKTFSAINIAGLAIGIAVFMLIMEFVTHEWNANRFHKNYDRLNRATVMTADGDAGFYLQPGLSKLIAGQFPGVESVVRTSDGIAAGLVSRDMKGKEPVAFREEQILYADSNILRVFSFTVLKGKKDLPSNELAMSRSTASRYFGKEQAVGQVVTVSNQFGSTLYTVASVFEDMPANSDIKADMLLSFQTLESAANRNGNDWADPATLESGFVNIYLLLKPGAGTAQLSDGITAMMHKAIERSVKDKIILQPFKEMHLAPSFDYPLPTFGNLVLVVVFAGVAVLILFIAWINYINLSTAQALNRAKQVGVRKVLGATRIQLIQQYLAETFLVTLFSTMLAIILVQLLQVPFNNITGQSFSLANLSDGWFLLGGILLIVAGSFLSGTYVAFILSSYNPIKTIRNKISSTASGLLLRKSLVVFQFAISIVFIISTIVLYRQLHHMRSTNLGMNTEQLLVIQGPTLTTDGQSAKNQAFKQALARLSFVKSQAASNNVPGIGYNFSGDGITSSNPKPGDDKKNYSMFICDENFFSTYGITVTQGRAFNNAEASKGWSSAGKVIVNETAAKQLGFTGTDNPVSRGADPGTPGTNNIAGKKILWGQEFEIVGVVKDYHHLSLQQPIQPTIFLPSASFGYFTIKTGLDNLPAKLATLKQLYRESFPNNPFDYFFADEQFNKQYAAETRLGNVFIAAACVAVFIACMGLFGLATFAARQRVKEIGIRKVLGADTRNIVLLLSGDFVKLVVVAIFIASPIAWYIASKWLQDFAYPAQLSWWIFVLAGAIAILIAVSTVSIQAMKAALMNPVKNLRAE